jgi:hypothetical protein
MSSQYAGLSATEANKRLIGVINAIVADAMDEARAITSKEWEERDAAYLPHYFASAIFYAVQNRLAGAP